MSLSIQYKFELWLENQLSYPGENVEQLALKKRVWLFVAPGIFVISLAGIILWILGLHKVATAMEIFAGFQLILLVAVMIFRRYIQILALINQYFFVIISFVGVLYFGGILNSAGLVLVGLAGALQSVFFLKPHQIKLIFAIYLLTVIVEVVLQPMLVPLPEITSQANLILFVIHIIVIALALFRIQSFYISQIIKMKESEKRQLQELDTVKTNFYTNISHEFRTPLAVIMGMSDQIHKDPHKYLQEGLRLIRRNCTWLLHLVNQILDLSKLEAKSMQLHYVQIDIIPFLRQTSEPFVHLAHGKNIGFHFLSDFDEFKMDFDPEKITSLVSNLISNAIKYSESGSNVYLIVSEERKKDQTQYFGFSPFSIQGINAERMLRLTVKDTGVGILESEFPLIFERFYRGPISKLNHQDGSGIGLVLVKELVLLLGGNLFVKSVPGKGSEFTILLPVTNIAEDKDNHVSSDFGYKETEYNKTDNLFKRQLCKQLPHLLIIEDNDDVVTYLRYLTEEEYLLDRAKDGEQGIIMAQEIIPDIVLTDIMMAKRNGYEVCKSLKQDIRTSHIPVILLSAKADKESQIEGIECGADAYLTKPFNPKELLVRMRTLIENREKLIAKYRAYAITSLNEDTEPVNPDEMFLKELKEIMKRNYEDDSFDTNQLTSIIGMSRVQLFRKLKALTGVSASHFIRFYRLSRAKEKIIKTRDNISEIAYEVGFKDPAYFTRAFNKEFGVTPTSLRN